MSTPPLVTHDQGGGVSRAILIGVRVDFAHTWSKNLPFMAVPIWARNHLTPSSGLQHPSALGAMPPAKAPPVAKGGATAKANADWPALTDLVVRAAAPNAIHGLRVVL